MWLRCTFCLCWSFCYSYASDSCSLYAELSPQLDRENREARASTNAWNVGSGVTLFSSSSHCFLHTTVRGDGPPHCSLLSGLCSCTLPSPVLRATVDSHLVVHCATLWCYSHSSCCEDLLGVVNHSALAPDCNPLKKPSFLNAQTFKGPTPKHRH